MRQDLLVDLGVLRVEVRLVCKTWLILLSVWNAEGRVFDINLKRMVLDLAADRVALGVQVQPSAHNGGSGTVLVLW